MTYDEYLVKLKQTVERHQLELYELRMSYIIANNPYKIGDVIEDKYQKGVIREIHYFNDPKGVPTCAYSCTDVTNHYPITIYLPNVIIK